MDNLRVGKLDTPRMGQLRAKVNEDFVRDGSILRMFLLGHVLSGIGLITLSVYLNTVDRGFVEFANMLLGSLDIVYKALFNFFLFGPLVAGVLCILLTVIAIFTSSSDTRSNETLDEMLDRVTCKTSHRLCHRYCGSTSRGIFRLMIFVLAIMFLLQIAFASLYLVLLESVLGSVEQKSSDSPIGDLEAEVSSLQLAMFNLCCEEEGWSAHDPVPLCDANGQPPESCGLTGDAASFSDVLCTCYPREDSYTSYYESLSETREICLILSEAIVEISPDQQIPQTNTPLNAFVKASRARIVGFNGMPADDNTTAEEPKGYGCGFGGYARAFQFQQFMYISQRSHYVAVAVIVISVVELILVIGMVCQQLSSDDDRFFDKVLIDMESDRAENPRFNRPAREANLAGRITPFQTRRKGSTLPAVSSFDIKRDGGRNMLREDTPDF